MRYAHEHRIRRVHAAGNVAGLTALFVLFSALVAIALLGPRRVPYPAHEDRRISIECVVTQALAVCIVAPVLIAASLVVKRCPARLAPGIPTCSVRALQWPCCRSTRP